MYNLSALLYFFSSSLILSYIFVIKLYNPLSLQILIETQELPGSAGQDQREAILKNPDNLAVCTVVKLLRTIAVNGFRYVREREREGERLEREGAEVVLQSISMLVGNQQSCV